MQISLLYRLMQLGRWRRRQWAAVKQGFALPVTAQTPPGARLRLEEEKRELNFLLCTESVSSRDSVSSLQKQSAPSKSGASVARLVSGKALFVSVREFGTVQS
jgi:hypothetical protein